MLFKAIYRGKTLFNNFTGYEFYYNILQNNDPDDGTALGIFLNKPKVLKDLHVGNRSFNALLDNNYLVLSRIVDDFLRSVKDIMAVIMNNYKVLLYSGNLDIAIAPVFNNQFLNKLKWKHSEDYLRAERKIWKIGNNGMVAGYVKSIYEFHEVIIRNSGHTVPQHNLSIAFKMIKNL
ncbi:putative serine carboxypeptidase CPVL-like isoform X1 [Leptotrombidium deliense]|uniref:Putative serine carboxypeptidase CPVL-like isoform X1 n=1 Tax=Leptotrombidium deliense TaxID=299467 RepID=A0A443RTJ3_9ACAR|nr:putative serine carboxypeptidase CPVL-like isoform X1 [Leptotrombidium deliense]